MHPYHLLCLGLILILSSRIVFFIFAFGIVIVSLLIQSIVKVSFRWTLLWSFFILWTVFLNVNPFDINTDKHSMLLHIPKEYLPKQDKMKDLHRTSLDTLRFPIILKPVRCTGLSRGIFIASDVIELYQLFQLHPQLTNGDTYMYQEYITWENEATLLYENGVLSAIVEKRGKEPIRAYCKECIDLSSFITPQLQDVVRTISKRIPHFYAGRYDIRYETLDELQQGHFKILEVNGSMGFDLRKDTSPFPTNLSHTLRWFLVRLLIGLQNMLSGRGYSLRGLVEAYGATIANTFSCRDWEQLFAMYA